MAGGWRPAVAADAALAAEGGCVMGRQQSESCMHERHLCNGGSRMYRRSKVTRSGSHAYWPTTGLRPWRSVNIWAVLGYGYRMPCTCAHQALQLTTHLERTTACKGVVLCAGRLHEEQLSV